MTDYPGYGSQNYVSVYSKYDKDIKNTDGNIIIKDNITLMRDILINKIVTLPPKKKIFKYNNNHEYIPIINKSVTKVTYIKRNKDIIYDFMMSYHEDKYVCWFLYCIIINIYITIDDINIQGGFIRNMFERNHIKKSYLDIDMYLLSEFLIKQKEFIKIDFELKEENKSCWSSLPAYMNFIDSTVCILNKLINENTNIITDITNICMYDRLGVYPNPENYSINVSYNLICNNKTYLGLSFDINKNTYSAFYHDIKYWETNTDSYLVKYYNELKENNIDNVDYLQNSLILVKNKKTNKLEIDLRIPISKLNILVKKTMLIFNQQNIIIILLNYQPFIKLKGIIDIISSFLSDEDLLKIIMYYSIACGIMIPCHALCTNCTDLYKVDTTIFLIRDQLIKRYAKFRDREYKILETRCDKAICNHTNKTSPVDMISIYKYIEKITCKHIELLNNKI